MKGWVYIITNKAMPYIVKVGYSTKDPELRAAELNHTGSPHPYVVEYEVLVEGPRHVERKVHERLSNERENQNKEWFRCTTEEAVAAIKAVVGTKALVENYKRADRAKAEAIKQRREAEERSRRTAEEERRALESVLGSERQKVIARYEPLLKAAHLYISFWVYFAGFFIILDLALDMFFPKMRNVARFLLSAIGSFIISPFVKKYFEEKLKGCVQYQSILAKRDAELAAIESDGLKLREDL
jgi:hypothetical protein